MPFIVVSGIIGAGAAFFILWPFGALIACFGAPFGGGIFAGLAALWLGRRSADCGRQVTNASDAETPESHAARMKASSSHERHTS
jgi:hypothetical protein